MTDLILSDRAKEQLSKLEHEDSERMVNKLQEATEWPDHYLEPIPGHPYHKLRAGDYRAIVNWDRDKSIIKVRVVRHRRNVYDREL